MRSLWKRGGHRSDHVFILNLMAEVVNSELPTMFQRVVEGVREQFQASHACIHLTSDHEPAMEVRMAALRFCPAHEAQPEDMERVMRAEALLQQQAVAQRRPVGLSKAREGVPDLQLLLSRLQFEDGIAIPLIYQGELYGVLNLYGPRTLRAFDPQVFTALGGVLYGAVKREIMLKRLRERDDTVDTIARLVEARDPYTGGHAERVRITSRRMAELLGLAGQELHQVERAALLHDVGKIGVSDSVLHKPGPLDPEERRQMERHPVVGREVLSGISDPDMATIIAGVAWHHERPDGKGYPDGLKADEIPLVARIIAVSDTFDAMVSDRAYRSGMPLERALAILQAVRGEQLDAGIVDLFISHQMWREAFPDLGAVSAASDSRGKEPAGDTHPEGARWAKMFVC